MNNLEENKKYIRKNQNPALGALEAPKELKRNGWDFVPGVASIRSIGRAFQNPTGENIFWAIVDPALDLSTLATLGGGATWATAARTGAKGAAKIASEAALKEIGKSALTGNAKIYAETAIKNGAKTATINSAKKKFYWGLPGTFMRTLATPYRVGLAAGLENSAYMYPVNNVPQLDSTVVNPNPAPPQPRDTVKITWDTKFKEGGRVIPKNQPGNKMVLNTNNSSFTFNDPIQAAANAAAAGTNSAVVPAKKSRYELAMELLGGDGENIGSGGNNIQDYANNNRLSRREMRTFNRQEGLGMTRAERRAAQRLYNGNERAGDQALANRYYERLYKQTNPVTSKNSNSVNDEEQYKKDHFGMTEEAFNKGALEYRTQQAWDAYKRDNPIQATKDYDPTFKTVADLQKFLYELGNNEGETWDDVVLKKYGADNPFNSKVTGENGKVQIYDGRYGDATKAWIDAYLNSLTSNADKNLFLDKLSGLNIGYTHEKFNTAPSSEEWFNDYYNNGYTKDLSDEDLANYMNYLKEQEQNTQRATAYGAIQNKLTFKNGGMLNKYQQGGAAPQQASALKQILSNEQAAQAFCQAISQQVGQEIGPEQLVQLILSNPQAVEQLEGMAQQFLALISGQAQAAKRGAKLNYLHTLSSGCPEGTEAKYYQKGGHICKACVEKTKKAQEGAELPAEKCGGKAKKKYFTGGATKACSGAKASKHENGGQLERLKAIISSK